jgi:hypothetical protein
MPSSGMLRRVAFSLCGSGKEVNGRIFRASPFMGHGPSLRVFSKVRCNSHGREANECLLSSVCFYVAFRTPNPDQEALNAVKKDLKENGLDFNQLVKWETNHC